MSDSHLCLLHNPRDLVEEGDLALEGAVEVGFLVGCVPQGAQAEPGMTLLRVKSQGLQGGSMENALP